MYPNSAEVRACATRLPQEEQATVTAEQVLARLNQRFLETDVAKLPLSDNMKALIFVSLADLLRTPDQSQVLTSLMAHRSRGLQTTEVRLAEMGDLLRHKDLGRQPSLRSFAGLWPEELSYHRRRYS